MAHNYLLIPNNIPRDLLAQLLRTRNVVCIQRRIEEVAHIRDDWTRGEEHVPCAFRTGDIGESEGAGFDGLWGVRMGRF